MCSFSVIGQHGRRSRPSCMNIKLSLTQKVKSECVSTLAVQETFFSIFFLVRYLKQHQLECYLPSLLYPVAADGGV